MGLAAVAALAAAAVVSLAGCSNLGYYLQSATGHLKLMGAARPVPEVLQDEAVPLRVKDKLAQSQEIRSYASSVLLLPDNPSYRRYADLKRSAAVWNVVAAPLLSLELKTWCFPVTGCVGYRGYYDEEAAKREVEQLRAQGYESAQYPVPAYSTLGMLNWAGGDPLLNTFIGYPEGELARLIFHELAHQVIYAKNDTMFNESFATAVERLGGTRWLAERADDRVRREFADYDGRRRQFRALAQDTRRRLEDIYASAVPDEEKLRQKAQAMADFRAGFAQLKASWGGEPARWRNYDLWVERANNATLGAQAAYDELVPGFEALFEREGRDWQRFYDAARRLAGLPKEERHRILKENR